MIRRGVKSLCQNVITSIALNFLLIFLVLIAPILIASQNQKIADMLPPSLELVSISEIVRIIIKTVREDMLDVISVSLGLPIHIHIKHGRIAHANIDI